ncbi:MAG: glutamate--tRNA ligase [Bacteroidota bacterium]|nr:glutamate--tRNA ligase [Bacteroidota bacterium]
MPESSVRVRFAPSPTGPLHIGGVRTALYNYLFAKKNKGKMILRIEDTDQNRFVPGAESYIIEALEWSGIRFDEGVVEGGPYGPYLQSSRRGSYAQYAFAMVKRGNAYFAFDTTEELDAMRKRQEKSGARLTGYNQQARMEMKNSLTLSKEEVDRKIHSGDAYVVRIRIPENQELKIYDEIRKEIIVNTSTLDDKVLYKSDGMPTYHLANVVDDHLMKISHVIRGEEWLPSLPLHVLLYQYLGWSDTMPKFAHLPLLLKPDGKGKLSKRDGDKLGFPVFPLQWTEPKTGDISSGYRESGYYPEAFINMLALLGWNPGTEQEIFKMDEMIRAFSLERVGRSGSRFDPEKARWFNHQYLVRKTNEELGLEYFNDLKGNGFDVKQEKLIKIVGLIKERADFVKDFWKHSWFFLSAPQAYDEKTVRKRWKGNTSELLEDILSTVEKIDDFSRYKLENIIKEHIEEKELPMGQVMIGLRICLVGSGMGPDLFAVMEILGKEETIGRVRRGIASINNDPRY